MNIIGHRRIFLSVSGALVAVAAISMVFFGFRFGIDFVNGSLWQVEIPGVSEAALKEFFETKLEISDPVISVEEDTYSIIFREIAESERQEFLAQLEEEFGIVNDLDFWVTSPSVSEELRSKAITAVILVLVAISLYVAFAFRKVSRPVSSWKYGVITLVTLAHDVIIPAGIFAAMGASLGLVVDTNFLVALLVIIGFSVHDTIVVFDRTRENLFAYAGREEFDSIVNRSVNETITRSINTSLTLAVILVVAFFLGPLSLRYFVLTILLGTIVGTYSSIFVASPLLVVVHKLSRR